VDKNYDFYLKNQKNRIYLILFGFFLFKSIFFLNIDPNRYKKILFIVLP